MDIGTFLLLAGAGMIGGICNAVASGGTFFTFPALLAAGVPPVVANAVKNAMATVVTSAAVMLFVATGSIAWAQGSAVLLGAIVGGYAGARLAHWIPPLALRWTIVATGLALSAYFGLKAGA
ncbi:hypothetical protein CR64_18985 [Pseudomonas aeruginosa]|uniref:sulfite exporter TauE/SafE family protein n=1 Tax=Pseudomonas aeruginosa TaxID=287 RepID=UPI0004D78F13|nr:sulfite exporter TauE/SafE family protein [Pseudomonas aeruginosa]KEA40996.1 hypothetical protein CR64_18985 [Pseudomonas aeruginosa]PBZ53632.1 hypothetical protein CJU56_07955 [Pseudomonas aeruginosa]PBZ59375.1 hypothetical protein CJU55_11125 [Pseudomonas aeruginosa]PBZ65638.1 hypothetical protein CJU54_11560 [Pseudomonas aeruginosa]